MMSTRIGVRAMTLVELLVLVVVLSTITLVIAPSLASMRDASLNEQSKANLMQIAQGRDQYAMDNKGRIFTYTWRAGETYIYPDGRRRTASDDL